MFANRATTSLGLVLAVLLACVAGCNSSPNKLLGSSGHGPDASADAPSPVDATMGFGDSAAAELLIQPQNQTLTAMGPGATLQFSAVLAGSMSPVQATWSVTSGVQIGSISAAGLYTAGGTAGGTVNVQAQYGTLTAQTQLHVVLSIVDNAGNLPPSEQQQLTAGGDAGAGDTDAGPDGGADAAFAWLYPYDGTVFPRGLLPPTLQFGGVPPDAVYLHISFGSLDYQGFFGPSNPGRITLSAAAWTAITESAGSGDSVQVQLTKLSGGVVAGPITEHWTIAQGSLKGTVYYESRSGSSAGSTNRIRPGAAQPEVLFTTCTVCHYVSADGSTLVAESDINAVRSSAAYDLTNAQAVLSQAAGETYAFAALYKDGTIGMSGGLGGVLGSQGVSPSQLYDIKTGMQIPATGWDGTITKGVLPSFSPDGTQIVFNHFDTGQGHTLATMGFNRTTTTFSSPVDIATDPNNFLAYPGFTPDNEWVVLDATSDPDFLTCAPACCGNFAPGLPKADLEIVHTPSKTIATLDSLNGLANGQYYLPYGEAAEGHMNFQPTILPVAVGGYYWVVFTSRREYGNLVNTSDPYYCSDSSAAPWRKKLWVAALDIDNPETPSTSAHDISHPAFYLDGQDLQTGNYRGFWALSPCEQMGEGCQSGDECCSGFCRQVTGDAGAPSTGDAADDASGGADGGPSYVCVPPQACANEYEKCTTSADCCGMSQGLQCIAGYCGTTAQ